MNKLSSRPSRTEHGRDSRLSIGERTSDAAPTDHCRCRLRLNPRLVAVRLPLVLPKASPVEGQDVNPDGPHDFHQPTALAEAHEVKLATVRACLTAPSAPQQGSAAADSASDAQTSQCPLASPLSESTTFLLPPALAPRRPHTHKHTAVPQTQPARVAREVERAGEARTARAKRRRARTRPRHRIG